MEVLANILTNKDKIEAGKAIGKTSSTFLRERKQGWGEGQKQGER